MMSQLQAENENCAFQLGEQDVEMERMKTTIFALNQKLVVTDELQE
jgi:hypothetical protein